MAQARIRLLQSSFMRGELDPLMAARVDVASYFEGAKTCRDWLLLDQGGLMRRPGTLYKATLTGRTRLLPFTFAQDERYLLAFSNLRLDVFDMDGVIVQSNVTAPWTEAQLFELDYAQFGDTMFVVHQGMPMQEVVRTSAATFTIADFVWEAHSSGYPIYQPYFKYAVESVTIAASATTGSVNLTVSAAHWVTGHIGLFVRVAGKTCEITAITSALIAVATVHETLASTAATVDWDEELYSGVWGYPGGCALHEQRLWFGGSTGLPSGLTATNIAAFRKHDLGTAQDDEAIQVTLGSDHINEIRHIVSSRHLQIFTDLGEFYPPLASGEAITPGNVAFRRQTRYGSSHVQPQDLDGATIFVQRTLTSIREFIFEDLSQSYAAGNLTMVSPHLLDAPYEATSMRGNTVRPEQYAMFVNDNGTIAVFHSARAEKIAGWTLWRPRTGDKFVSVQAVAEDLFCVTQRSVNGSTVHYLEKFSEDDSVTLDCQITVAGSGLTFSGLTHLAGEADVWVIAQGFSLGPHDVSGAGAVTIDETGVTSLIVGLNYTPTLETMPPDAALASGPMTGEVRRIVRALVTLDTALAATLDGQDLIVRQAGDDLSVAPAAVTGTYEFFMSGYSRNPTVTLVQNDPLSLRVLALAVEVAI
jgi:hypothetical protein